MGKKDDHLEKIRELFLKKKVYSLHEVSDCLGISARMVQLYLKNLHSLTSYTHSGKFVTLPDIPRYDGNGIWYYHQVGFSKFGSSLDTIIKLIEHAKSGLSREDLERILKIAISKQIQILIQRERLHRIKLGNKYLYIPENLMKDEKKKLKLVGDRQTEEYFEKDVGKKDLIALLKAVLIEKKVGIEMGSIKRIAKKYALRIPLKKIAVLLQKYDLSEKKSPDSGK